MNKESFLSSLRKELTILKVEEVEDIIQEYESHIEEHLANGLTEEQAIEEFGDFGQLVEGILEAYNIDRDYASSYRKKVQQKEKVNDFVNKSSSTISDIFDNVITFINEISKNIYAYFEESSSARIVMTLLIVLMIAVAIERVEVLILGFIIIVLVHQSSKYANTSEKPKPTKSSDNDNESISEKVDNLEENVEEDPVNVREEQDSNTGMYVVKLVFVAFVLIIFIPFILSLFFGSLGITISLLTLLFVYLKTNVAILISIMVILSGLLIIFVTTLHLIISVFKAVTSK